MEEEDIAAVRGAVRAVLNAYWEGIIFFCKVFVCDLFFSAWASFVVISFFFLCSVCRSKGERGFFAFFSLFLLSYKPGFFFVVVSFAYLPCAVGGLVGWWFGWGLVVDGWMDGCGRMDTSIHIYLFVSTSLC